MIFSVRQSLLSLLLGYSLLSSMVFGNGGGYHYGVKFTGTVAPFTAEGTENVQILDEKLDIILGDDAAKVSVLYKMKNVTDKKVKVKFGFPVEDVESSWDLQKNEITTTHGPAYTRDYLVTLNGKVLKHKFMVEPFGSDKKKGLAPFKGSEILKEIKGWQVSTMSLEKGETVSLHIAYYSQYDQETVSISDDVTSSAHIFKYRLSTGAVWHGPIKQGSVTVSYVKALDPEAVRVEKPVNRFKKVGDKFVWKFKNLEPTLADDITIQAKPEESEYYYSGDDKKIYSYVLLDRKWFIKHQKFSLTATSTLPDQGEHSYKVDNLKKPWEGIWSEGVQGSGIGESITLKLTKPRKVPAISMMNGYCHEEELFQKNNRIKTMEVLINGKVKKTFTLPDTSDERRYFLEYSKPVSALKLTIKEGQIQSSKE